MPRQRRTPVDNRRSPSRHRDTIVLAALALFVSAPSAQVLAQPLAGSAEVPVVRPTGSSYEEPVDAPAVGAPAVACVQRWPRQPSWATRGGHVQVRLLSPGTFGVLVRTWC